jgi:group I intron endonuclease
MLVNQQFTTSLGMTNFSNKPKQPKISGIYKITIVDQFYIGASTDMYLRKKQHLWLLRSGVFETKKFQDQFNKYGESAFEFEILELAEPHTLQKREQWYITNLKPPLNYHKIASRIGVIPVINKHDNHFPHTGSPYYAGEKEQ